MPAGPSHATRELRPSAKWHRVKVIVVTAGNVPPRSGFRGYAYGWITLGLFLFSLLGHWIFGWFAYVDEQQAHGQPIDVIGYTVQMGRDTLENWQSEFLQLLWQVGGLTYFLYLGSPQSRDGDERKEAKIDAILRRLDPEGDRIVSELDERYPRR